MMEIRLANRHEAEVCYQCIEDARAYHKSLGFEQWHPDYPTLLTILDDVDQSIGYVFAERNEVIGYCCIVFGNEPSYDRIDKQNGHMPRQGFRGCRKSRFCNSRSIC